MTNPTIENQLLRLIVEETARVLSLSPHRDLLRDDSAEWVARSTAIRDLKAGLGIRISSGWIGNTPADRQARRRGLLALEAAGLVTLSSANGSHATHVATVDDDDDPDDADEDATASPLPRAE